MDEVKMEFKLKTDLSIGGVIDADVYTRYLNVFMRDYSLRAFVINYLTLLLSTAANKNWIVMFNTLGINIVQIDDYTDGLLISYRAVDNKYVYTAVAQSNFADSALLYACASVIKDAIKLAGNRFNDLINYDPDYLDSTVGTIGALSNVTGVTLSNPRGYIGNVNLAFTLTADVTAPTNVTGVTLSAPSGESGTYTLAYTADVIGALANITGVTLTDFRGTDGNFNFAYVAPTISALTNVTGVTLSHPTGEDATHNLVFVAETMESLTNVTGVVLSQPRGADVTNDLLFTVATIGSLTNVTGVTLSKPIGVDVTNDLVFTYNGGTGMTLTWGGGTPVVVDAGGAFTLTDAASNTIVATVVVLSLPGSDQTDAGVAVTVATLAWGAGDAVNIGADGAHILTDALGNSIAATTTYASLDTSDQTDADISVTVATLTWGGDEVVVNGDGAVTLTDASGNTITATVVYNNLDASNQTDADIAAKVATLAVGDGTPVTIDDTGAYTISNGSGSSFVATIAYASLSGTNQTDNAVACTTYKLTWGGGSATNVSAGGAITLTASDTTTVVATVVVGSLPAGNKSDADLEVTADGNKYLTLGSGPAVEVSGETSVTLTDTATGLIVTAAIVEDDLPDADQTDTSIAITEALINANTIVASIGNEA